MANREGKSGITPLEALISDAVFDKVLYVDTVDMEDHVIFKLCTKWIGMRITLGTIKVLKDPA